jgi:uncharacterized phage-associated protein
MSKINSIQLSRWIVHNLPKRPRGAEGLTHLKLQKLAFYCYGISIAKGYGSWFENICFKAWKHGPVSIEIYTEYKEFKIRSIEKEDVPIPSVEISEDLKSFMMKVLYIYGGLNAWKISHQSHLEKPWKEAFQVEGSTIEDSQIKECFEKKFFDGASRVYAPEYVFDLSSFKLDGIPTVGYSSFDALSDAVKRIYFSDHENM